MTDTTSIIGMKIRLDRINDRPCNACGSKLVEVESDSVLHCTGCRRRRGQLPKPMADFFEAAVVRFGLPSDPITIRSTATGEGK